MHKTDHLEDETEVIEMAVMGVAHIINRDNQDEVFFFFLLAMKHLERKENTAQISRWEDDIR